MSIMQANEIINSEYIRRDLLTRLATKTITKEGLDELHRLDSVLSGYDIVGIMFDEIARLTKQIENLSAR